MIKVKFTPKQMKPAIEFAIRAAKTQQAIEFGNGRTTPRPEKEIERDIVIGKLAELAVWKVLGAGEVDYAIYPRGKWDDQDLIIEGQRIDVKASRPGSRWLLVEQSKLEFRKREGKEPDAFVFCVTGWDRECDIPTGEVQVVGWASLRMVLGGERLSEGCYLPGTKVKLQASNYALHASRLDSMSSFKRFLHDSRVS